MVKYPLGHEDIIRSVYDPLANELMREGIYEELVLDNSSTNEQGASN